MRGWKFFFALWGLLFGVDLAGQTLNDHLWQRYRDSADIFRLQKNTDSAIQYYTLAMEFIPEDSINTDSYIQILTQTANLLYLNKSQYTKAESFYQNGKGDNRKEVREGE